MKVSTALFYERGTLQVTSAQARLVDTQAQLASGKQLVNPSDQPDQALVIGMVNATIDRQNGLASQLGVVTARLRAEEVALQSVSQILVRFKELGLKGVDDSVNTDGRQAIVREMQVLREQVLALANTQDDQGQSLFGGSSVNDTPFVEGPDGRVRYQGDQTASYATSDGRRLLDFNRAGTDAFPRLVRTVDGQAQGVGFFDALDDLIAGVAASDRVAMTLGLKEMQDLIDANSVAVVENGADQNAIDTQVRVVEESLLRMRTTLSDLEDLDYAEAISRMNQQKMSLEAALGSFAKVAQLSLFNYLDG
jgi:flagellar hook-associated protein 3 FlgL